MARKRGTKKKAVKAQAKSGVSTKTDDEKSKCCGQKKWMRLLMRLSVAFIFLWHGLPKAMDAQMAMGKFAAMGFPAFLGPVVGWVEVIAALLLIVGYWTRYASYALAAIMVVSLAKVHIPNGVTAGLERDLMLLVALLVLATHGPGKYSMCKYKKK